MSIVHYLLMSVYLLMSIYHLISIYRVLSDEYLSCIIPWWYSAGWFDDLISVGGTESIWYYKVGGCNDQTCITYISFMLSLSLCINMYYIKYILFMSIVHWFNAWRTLGNTINVWWFMYVIVIYWLIYDVFEVVRLLFRIAVDNILLLFHLILYWPPMF